MMKWYYKGCNRRLWIAAFFLVRSAWVLSNGCKSRSRPNSGKAIVRGKQILQRGGIWRKPAEQMWSTRTLGRNVSTQDYGAWRLSNAIRQTSVANSWIRGLRQDFLLISVKEAILFSFYEWKCVFLCRETFFEYKLMTLWVSRVSHTHRSSCSGDRLLHFYCWTISL